jgi:hypothetical protein
MPWSPLADQTAQLGAGRLERAPPAARVAAFVPKNVRPIHPCSTPPNHAGVRSTGRVEVYRRAAVGKPV